MKAKIHFIHQLLCLMLCFALLLAHTAGFSLKAFEGDAVEGVTAGDFTIASTDGEAALTDGVDYTYADGTLAITTTTPVTVGMKDGIENTAERIVTDSTNGEAAITFHNINIETTKDEAITVQGSAKTTLYFSGTNHIVSGETGIHVSGKTPLTITSIDEGRLNISGVKYGIACISYSTTQMLEIAGNISIDISGCTMHAIYYREGAVSISGTPVINIDTVEYAIYGIGIDISGGKLTFKNDDGYIVCSGSGNPLTLRGQTDLHIMEGDRGLYTNGGKITITDSVKLKIYGGDTSHKTAAILEYAISSDELLIDKNAMVDVFTQEYAITGGITTISDNAQVSIKINSQSSSSRYALRFDSPLNICGNAKVDIEISGSKVYGLYDITDGTVNISDQAVVAINGAYRSIYADFLNLSGNGSLTITDDLDYAVYGVITIQDSAKLTATSTEKKVLYEEFTVKPSEGQFYMVRTGASEAAAATDYYTAETTRSEKSSWRYFHAEPTDTAPVTVTFESNGGTPMDSITVNFGEKYGKLPSSSVTGLSGGDSNWYLIDEKGNVTDTKITNATTVAIAEAHKLFVKRKVLAPTLKVTLEVPGAVSDGYQYYVPDHSQRILTVTINNQNTDILDYTYQWYKDGNAIEGAAQEKLTLDGNVSDSGIYTVKVTATLIDNTGIVVTSDTAAAEKEQKVKILHAANTLYYHANEGEGGPTSNFTGGTAVTVSKDEPSRSGYLFNGWNTKADGTGESYDAGSTYTFTEDNGNGGCSITLYAQWIKAYDIYVGGVQITDANKADVFENGKVSYDADHSTLTIKDWYYQGEGYQYGSDTNDQDKIEYYSAAIYSKDAITIKLEGDNVLKNTFNDSGEDHYGDGIIADGSVKIIGGGSLGIYGAYAINAAAGITIDDIRLYAKTTDHAVNAIGGELIINHAVLEVIAESDGIYANKEITITDSIVNIEADADGIYSYDGYVAINCTKVSVNNDPNLAPALTGTKVSVKSKEGKGIFAYKGLEINDKLTVSVPDGAKIGDVYVENGDYTYYTVKSGSTVAKEIVIEPFAYTVTITGFGFEMAIPVPSGMSLNEAYGEDYFADLNPTNENYIFGGWYKDGNCTAGNEFDFAAAVTSDITVYPKWIPILYTVVVDNAEGGEVFVDPQTAQKGEIVIITPKPDRNKEVDAITVTDKNGNAVAVIQNDDGTYSFTQPESEVVIKVTYRDKQTGTAGGDTGKNNNEPFDNPQTGDNSNLWLWFALALVSGGCLFGTALYSKKKNRAEEDY